MIKISNRRIAKVYGKDFLKWYRSSEAFQLLNLKALILPNSFAHLSILRGYEHRPTVEFFNGSDKNLKIYRDKSLSLLYKDVPPHSSTIIERLPNGRYDYYIEDGYNGTMRVKA